MALLVVPSLVGRWIAADRKKIIFDTGLYNLTKKETPALLHMDKDKTEQWLLVRLKQAPDRPKKL